MSNEKNPGCLGCIGDDILPNYMGILISQYKDPYKPTRIQWKVVRVFFVAQMLNPRKPKGFFRYPNCGVSVPWSLTQECRYLAKTAAPSGNRPWREPIKHIETLMMKNSSDQTPDGPKRQNRQPLNLLGMKGRLTFYRSFLPCDTWFPLHYFVGIRRGFTSFSFQLSDVIPPTRGRDMSYGTSDCPKVRHQNPGWLSYLGDDNEAITKIPINPPGFHCSCQPRVLLPLLIWLQALDRAAAVHAVSGFLLTEIAWGKRSMNSLFPRRKYPQHRRFGRWFLL